MKNFILVVFALLIASSCVPGKKERLIGTWVSVSDEKRTASKDSALLHYFIEFTDHGIFYLNQLSSSKYYFFKGYSMDSVHYETIKFHSKDNFEILFSDSVKRNLKMSKNPQYVRVDRNIRPDIMIIDLYNGYFPLGTPLEIDTLRDSTVYYHCYLPGNENMSITELENEIKFFFDKQMKAPPGEVLLNEYDQTSGRTFNEYTWKNPESRIFMQCYFKFRDAAKKPTINNIDQLEVKIWQNIK